MANVVSLCLGKEPGCLVIHGLADCLTGVVGVVGVVAHVTGRI
jgi:hypothetical protein